jgi:outer membrane protein assembly factor BamB
MRTLKTKRNSNAAAGAIAMAMMWISVPAFGQVMTVTDDAVQPDQGNGFVVRKEAKPTLDALEDFERFRDKRAWEKAFSALDKVASTDPGRLVSAGNGFYVPTTDRILSALLSLPPDGRQAYRLFNDARAQQLLDQAATSPDEVGALRNVVGRYFITSIGDKAADRLGDALFERGDFNAAERSWRLVIDSFPDTTLSIPLLQTKRVIALTRASDGPAADAIAANLDPAVTVHLAGRESKIGDVLASLKSAVESAKPGAMIHSSSVVELPGMAQPAGKGPIWQIPLVDPDQLKALKVQVSQNGWSWMVSELSQTVPSTAIDQERIYVNYGGVCFAADLRTGKVLWQTDSLGDTLNKMRQMTQMGSWYSNAAFSTTLCGDNVMFTRSESPNGNRNSLTTMLCLAGPTGKMVWRTDRGALSAYSLVGMPLVQGDQFLMIGHKANAAEVALLCIDAATGNIKWSTALGEFTSGASIFGGAASDPTPTILRRMDKLDVLTNNGAILEVDLNSHNVEWAFTYATAPPSQPYYYYNSPAQPPNAPGAMIADATTLYFKERTNDVLYAIDPARHELKWKRPVDSTNTLVAIDAGHMILSGASAQCIDLESRELLWDTPLSTVTGDMRPLLSGTGMYTLGGKGVEAVDLATGNIKTTVPGGGISGGEGGDLWKTSDRLITVSASTVTAYAVAPSGGK